METKILSLHDAVRERDLRAVIRYIEPHRNVDNLNSQLDTPLTLATRNKDLDMIRLLVKCGASVNTAMSTPCKDKVIGHCTRQLTGGISASQENTLNNNTGSKCSICNTTSNKTIDLNDSSNTLMTKCITSLNDIRSKGSISRCNMTVSPDSTSINSSAFVGITPPLLTAITTRHYDTVSLLLQSGANVNSRTANQRTPLMLAAWTGDLSVTQLLTRHGADTAARDEEGYTALHIAAQHGHTHIVQHLLHGRCVDVNQTTVLGSTALHLACERGHHTVCHQLLNYGVNVNKQNNRGDTPLHNAVASGSVRAVRYLLAFRPRVAISNHEGLSAMDVARVLGLEEIDFFLIQHYYKHETRCCLCTEDTL